MRPGNIICNSIGADGKLCGATAVVHEVHYRYDVATSLALGGARVLTEIRSDIQCPRCGYRTQLESTDHPEVLTSLGSHFSASAGSISTPNVT
jgi:hypothetical protein